MEKTVCFTELKKNTGERFLSVIIDENAQLIHQKWEGYLTKEMLIEGGGALLKALIETGFTKIMADNRLVKGSWDSGNEYFEKEFNPKAYENGLKFLAVIDSDDIFAQLSLKDFNNNAKKLAEEKGLFETQIFTTEEDARNWLASEN